ncbi:hypothetical protein A0H81_06151 [Grifola frondosa]|uniref:FAD/NAD(P)-binding domain-containing protein n=1 Tax=Grifola frondosa TaxID=5627 RepID=A0A1C7MAR6_GRIFR|nr:hypothetical protein A0H81_06151 [Grifola frondosa]
MAPSIPLDVTDPRTETVGVIGAGMAGLITAYTLLQDGFASVEVLTRDKSIGGVWAKERVYPGLQINNATANSVHGEYRYSALPMPPPDNRGGRLTGDDMQKYLETFADKFLEGKIRFEAEVVNIRRDDIGKWLISISDKKTGAQEVVTYSRIVLCTGVRIGTDLILHLAQYVFSRDAATQKSQICCLHVQLKPHTSPAPYFIPRSSDREWMTLWLQLDPNKTKEAKQGRLHRWRWKISTRVSSRRTCPENTISHDIAFPPSIAAYLANEGRNVTVVFETTDAFLASTKPLPDFIRKSRLLSVLSPHIHLRTRLERFLHTTWLGSKLVYYFWNALVESSFQALGVPKDSPLRRIHSPFWSVRVNDEGAPRPNSFHSLVNDGKISLAAPARMESYGADGRSIILSDGRVLRAAAVILATGYVSSWGGIFDAKTREEVGMQRHPPSNARTYHWDYTTLANPPHAHPDTQQWANAIYRGLVPAKNIARRDFALNGSVFTTNNGYVCEVIAHWIASYFRGDAMRLPPTVEDACADAERSAAWIRQRNPTCYCRTLTVLLCHSAPLTFPFFRWPQAVDDLLEEMGLQIMRSGGSWLTWPFKVIEVREISTLKEERDAKRAVLKF